MMQKQLKHSQDMDLKQYLESWIKLNNELAEDGFTWGSLHEKDEWHQYMSLDVLEMTQDEINTIKQDTINFGQLVQATYKIVMNHSKYFSTLGLPTETWEAVSKEWLDLFSYFCRFDIILTPKGNKFIEINSDTPTGYLETSRANSKLCNMVGLQSPNYIEKSISHAWTRIIHTYGIPEEETIFFTSFGWHDEDRKTVMFNLENCPHQHTEYIEIEEIIVDQDGLYTPDGRRIYYLYRLYPLEYLPYDEDIKGNRIGLTFLNHIVEDRVKIINPPSAFVVQSKALLAIMWEIHDNEPYLYTKEELEYVERYVPKTHFFNDYFIKNNVKYVSKPLFGREGGGVSIIEGNNSVIEEDRTPEYFEQKKIYQEYIEMPDLTISTWDGPYTGKLLIGSFYIGGEPSGIFIRVGEKITGNLSMFIGVGL